MNTNMREGEILKLPSRMTSRGSAPLPEVGEAQGGWMRGNLECSISGWIIKGRIETCPAPVLGFEALGCRG